MTRARLLLLMRIVVSGAALGYLLDKAGLASVGRVIGDARPGWLVMGLVLGLGSVGVTVRQWQSLLVASGLQRTYRRCLHLELAGDVFDAALPSAIGGDLYRAVLASEAPQERVRSATTVVLRRICNFPGMVMLLGIGLAASAHLDYVGRILPFAIGALLAGAAAVALVVSPFFGRLARSRIMRWGPGRAVGKVLTQLDEFRGSRSTLRWAYARGLAFWAVATASQWCYMRAVGIEVPVPYAVLVVTTTTAITMLPISLGGYGLREGAFSAFLSASGLATSAQGIAVGACLTGQTVLLGLIGVPFYLTLRRVEPTPTRAMVLTGEPA